MATPHHPPHPVIFCPPSGPSPATLAGGVQEDGRGSRKARDWAELPRDALLLVLEKLHHVDVLRGPELVCRTWHSAVRDEPALWRRIDFRHQRVDDSTRWFLRLMAYAAVRRSRGRALWLKSLRIISCERIADRRLSSDIARFHMLELLEISNCYPGSFSRTCIVVGNSCPRLKSFRLSSPSFFRWNWIKHEVDSEVEGITRMRGLRSLQLFAQTVSTSGLASILDSCVQLESLDIRHCFNIEMGDDMMARCSRFETVRLPFDSTDDYDLEFCAQDMNRAVYSRHRFGGA
ncbi:hypothetical protein ACQ4PT_030472 [Festuca glaucescens]